MTSCKKCGFVFEKGNGTGPLVFIKSPVAEIDTEGGEEVQKEKPPDVSKTVSSIRESLEEIEEGKSESTENVLQEQTDRTESGDIQFQEVERSDEGSDTFPGFSEVNWEESISLASDELHLHTADDGKGQEEKIGLEDEESDLSYIKSERIQEELKNIGEELNQIEEEPVQSEPISPSEQTYESYDLSTVQKGGFWKRLGAFIIDNIILYILAFILTMVGVIALGLGSSGLEALEEEGLYSLMIPLYIFNAIITIVYYTYFHGSTGQTPGKMVCKLKVVRVSGEPLGYSKAFLRWVGYIVSSFVFCLGFLWVAWDKNKQAWHDKIAGTYVIRI